MRVGPPAVACWASSQQGCVWHLRVGWCLLYLRRKTGVKGFFIVLRSSLRLAQKY